MLFKFSSYFLVILLGALHVASTPLSPNTLLVKRSPQPSKGLKSFHGKLSERPSANEAIGESSHEPHQEYDTEEYMTEEESYQLYQNDLSDINILKEIPGFLLEEKTNGFSQMRLMSNTEMIKSVLEGNQVDFMDTSLYHDEILIQLLPQYEKCISILRKALEKAGITNARQNGRGTVQEELVDKTASTAVEILNAVRKRFNQMRQYINEDGPWQ